jgi:hypothetical protein
MVAELAVVAAEPMTVMQDLRGVIAIHVVSQSDMEALMDMEQLKGFRDCP